jgi:hypothetical protein
VRLLLLSFGLPMLFGDHWVFLPPARGRVLPPAFALCPLAVLLGGADLGGLPFPLDVSPCRSASSSLRCRSFIYLHCCMVSFGFVSVDSAFPIVSVQWRGVVASAGAMCSC